MKRERVIYKITNNVNGKFYIGKSVDYTKRVKDHKRNPPKKMRQDVKEYGWNNFTFSIIKDSIYSDIDAFTTEINYIKELKPFYNMTKGGEGIVGGLKGVDNGRSNLKEDEVIDICKRIVINGESRKSVLKIYPQTSLTAISRIVTGKGYEDIKRPTIKILENLKGENNPNSTLKEIDILDIGNRGVIERESAENILKDYPQVKKSAILDILNGDSWQHIIRPIKLKKIKGRDSTKEEVVEICNRVITYGEDKETVLLDYEHIHSISTLEGILYGKSYAEIERPILIRKSRNKPITKDQAIDIINKFSSGLTVNEIHINNYSNYNIQAIRHAVYGQSFKNLNHLRTW